MVPSRLVIGLLGFYACALLYSHRAALSVAIVSMVQQKNASDVNHKIGSCVDPNRTVHLAPRSGEYDWSPSTQGYILGALFYPYLVMPIVAGRISERFGAKWITAGGVFIPAVLTALIPAAADIHVGLVIGLRVLMGVCCGCVFASLFSLYANWFPAKERSTAIGGLAFGGNVGLVVTFPLSGYLAEYGFAGGWPSIFYVTALMHIPWLILWLVFVSNSPGQSKWISSKELEYIQKKCESFGAPKKAAAPWRSIATSKPVWACVIAKLTGSFGFYLLLTKMPAYLDSVFGIPIKYNGLFNSMSNLAAASTMLICGPLSAFIKRKQFISLTRIRKIFEYFSLLGPGICIGVIPFIGCDSAAVIALLIVAMFFYGAMTGGEWPIVADFAPDFAGTVFGIANTFGMAMGFVAPFIVGLFLDEKHPGDKDQWNIVFYITLAINIVGIIVFELFASAEPQHWGVVDKKSESETKNGEKKQEEEKTRW